MSDKKYKVMIIEDEKILVDILQKKLEKEGYDIYTAMDGKSGLEKIKEVKPDIILLDIIMPRLNGYEVLEVLKKEYGDKCPAVIIISNSGQPVEIDKAMRLGAKDYIVKAQFTPEEVVVKVKNLLGGTSVKPVVDSGPALEAQPSHETTSAMGGVRILVIEDDQFLRDLLKTKLNKEGFSVETAIDGPEGLEKILKEKPDLILLDIILPGIDGFEILKKIRKDVKTDIASMPTILLSNLGQEADVEKGRALGADDYLIKSNFTIDEIIAKIHKVLDKK